jgi:hypothetical protein
VIVVVVLGKSRDGHGVLGLHALAACATVEAGIGQKLNTPVLLCLVANLEVFNDLGLKRIPEKDCQAKERIETATKVLQMFHHESSNTKSRPWVVLIGTFCQISWND